MRIAWIVYGGLDQWTGGYVYDRLVVQSLRARGHELTVLSLRDNALLARTRLVGRLVLSSYDIVVGDELCHRELASAFAALGARRRVAGGPRRVLLVHHLAEWEDDRSRFSEWLCLRLAELVIATSHTSRQRLHRTFGIAAHACVPGSDRLTLLPRRAPQHGPAELLFVGTLTPRKGLVDLLEALLAVPDSNYRLSIVGDATRDPNTREAVRGILARNPSLAERTVLVGTLDDARLSELYARSDVLVAPSHFEGYGMAHAEALRAGLGVIATRVGAVTEAVGKGEHVLLVPARDRPALTDALCRVICRPELRERMQRAARRLCFAGWAETAERFERCLLGESGGGKPLDCRKNSDC